MAEIVEGLRGPYVRLGAEEPGPGQREVVGVGGTGSVEGVIGLRVGDCVAPELNPSNDLLHNIVRGGSRT